MSSNYQINKKKLVDREKEYHKNNKETLQEQAKNKYR